MRAIVVGLLLAACGGPPRTLENRDERVAPVEITLYRDRAIVKQHLEVDIPANGLATARVKIPRGVVAEDIVVVEHANLEPQIIRRAGDMPGRQPDPTPPPPDPVDEDEPELPGATATPPAPQKPQTPGDLEIVVASKRSGPAKLAISYVIADAPWEAEYTLVTTPARDRVTLRGALAIRNASGLAFPSVRLRVVDKELGPDTTRTAKQLAEALEGPKAVTQASSTATARDIGIVEVADGETRIPLVQGGIRALKATLVYDAVGPTLDRKGATPDIDRDLGARAGSSKITESYELVRDKADQTLPGGPARLLEERADGSLGLVAAARMFDLGTRDAPSDTISLGIAEGVTGRRERREITIDDDAHSITEEFLLTVENARNRPVEVVLREHLYRGQEWTVPYFSTPLVDKEGAQQIALRARAPAHGKVTVLYVVVYTTPEP